MTQFDRPVWSGSYLEQLESERCPHGAALVQLESSGGDEDWDMDAEHEVYMATHQDIEQTEDAVIDNGVKLLALDTNVLVDHLPRIQALYQTLIDHAGNQVSLLVPTTVVNELDGLKARAHLNAQVQAATSWLLHINKRRREIGYGPIRSQKWSERQDDSLRKGDDRILDCCLYFQSLGAEVVLWTADRNLSLLAETNEVPTIRPPPAASPSVIVKAAFDITLLAQSQAPTRSVPSIAPDAAADNMDLDGSPVRSPSGIETGSDMVPQSAEPSSPSARRYGHGRATSPRHGYSSRSAPSTPSVSRPLRTTAPNVPSMRSRATPVKRPDPSPQTLNAFIEMAKYIDSHLPPIPNQITLPAYDDTLLPQTNACTILTTLVDKMDACAVVTTGPGQRADLYAAIGGLKVLCTFVQPGAAKAPLAYEICAAMGQLANALDGLGIPLQRGALQRIMDDIKS